MSCRVTASLCITAAHCLQFTNFSNGPRISVGRKFDFIFLFCDFIRIRRTEPSERLGSYGSTLPYNLGASITKAVRCVFHVFFRQSFMFFACCDIKIDDVNWYIRVQRDGTFHEISQALRLRSERIVTWSVKVSAVIGRYNSQCLSLFGGGVPETTKENS
jgi:hypothetical protein